MGFDYKTEEFSDNHTLQFFLEYSFASGLEAPLQRDPLHFARRPFLYQLLGRVHYDWGENLDITLDAAAAPTRYDVMVAPEIRYTYNDSLTIGLKGTFLFGDETDSFYGAYTENSRVASSLELKF